MSPVPLETNYGILITHVIGICFGHQIISRALGKDCVPNGGRWECGITPVDLTEAGKELFGVDELVSSISAESGDNPTDRILYIIEYPTNAP